MARLENVQKMIKRLQDMGYSYEAIEKNTGISARSLVRWISGEVPSPCMEKLLQFFLERELMKEILFPGMKEHIAKIREQMNI